MSVNVAEKAMYRAHTHRRWFRIAARGEEDLRNGWVSGFATSVTDPGAPAWTHVRERHDLVVNRSRLGRLDHLVHRDALAPAPVQVEPVDAAIRNVHPRGRVEQDRLLRHEADTRAERPLGQVADVVAVDADRAARDVVEAVDELGDGALAAATRSDQGDTLASADLERDTLEDGDLLVGREGDIFELDLGAFGGINLELDGVRSVRDLPLFVQELNQLLGV